MERNFLKAAYDSNNKAADYAYAPLTEADLRPRPDLHYGSVFDQNFTVGENGEIGYNLEFELIDNQVYTHLYNANGFSCVPLKDVAQFLE